MSVNDVIVLPGLPRDLTKPKGIEIVYPDTTVDMIKVLRARGLKPAFAHPEAPRTLVGHKAFDVWMPILEFSRDLFTGVAGSLLATLIQDFFEGRSTATPIAHISWKVKHADGSVEEFNYDGPSRDAIESARLFEQAFLKRDSSAGK